MKGEFNDIFKLNEKIVLGIIIGIFLLGFLTTKIESYALLYTNILLGAGILYPLSLLISAVIASVEYSYTIGLGIILFTIVFFIILIIVMIKFTRGIPIWRRVPYIYILSMLSTGMIMNYSGRIASQAYWFFS